jgi:transcriptional regulator with XRE-family HTH domain
VRTRRVSSAVPYPDSRPQASPHAGVLLRQWRAARRVSQLDLALEANVSARHLSYVETGRAKPSRNLLSRLAETLDIPLRERNVLLIAAGYAPEYRETGLAAPEMAQARRAIELILQHQEPYPAMVLSRHWDLLMTNQGSARVFGWLLGSPPAQTNVLRQVFDPCGMRPLMVNWEEAAGDMINRLHSDIAAYPSDEKAKALLLEALSYPDVPPRWRMRELSAPAAPLWTAVYRKDDRELRFFWTITSFGTAQDVTLQELRIECSFPADESTDLLCRKLAAGQV